MGKFYRINQFIQAKEVRVVDETGKQLGVMPIFNAIQKAREAEVDLVEVAPSAKPPVCKIIDFKKFKYLEAKKEKEERKGVRGGGLKELRLSPFIAENDLNFRARRIKEFIDDGNKVKVRIQFKGREMTKKDYGFRILDILSSSVEGFAAKEAEPKLQGRELFVTFIPAKSKGTGVKITQNENEK